MKISRNLLLSLSLLLFIACNQHNNVRKKNLKKSHFGYLKFETNEEVKIKNSKNISDYGIKKGWFGYYIDEYDNFNSNFQENNYSGWWYVKNYKLYPLEDF